MHRLYFFLAGISAAIFAAVYSQFDRAPTSAYDLPIVTEVTQQPIQVENPDTKVAKAPDLHDLQTPDLTLLALPTISPGLETTQDATKNSARVASIVSFLNRDDTSDDLEILTQHVVRPGDSITKISQIYYGDDSGARRIYLANRFSMTLTNHIKVGQSLRIPAP